MRTETTSTADGIILHTVDAPVSEPKAIVYLVHGISEHSGRYAHVIKYLNERGYSVFSHDHRGHGRSGGDPVYFESFDVPVRDLKARISDVKAAKHGLKVFLYGHSMGSLIAALLVEQHQDVADGFISTGSPLWVDRILPGFVQPPLRGLARSVPRMPFIPANSSTISRDPQVVAAYDADPLVNRKPVKLGMVVRLAQASQDARDNADMIRLPLLVMHGEADKLCPPQGSAVLFEGASSADKTHKTYAAAYHEIHNEPEQGEVLAAIADWLDARV